jgi:hypothetical protein
MKENLLNEDNSIMVVCDFTKYELHSDGGPISIIGG